MGIELTLLFARFWHSSSSSVKQILKGIAFTYGCILPQHMGSLKL